MIGDPSMLRLIRKAAALARIFPHFDFNDCVDTFLFFLILFHSLILSMQARRKILDGVLNFVENTGRRSLYFKKAFSGTDS